MRTAAARGWANRPVVRELDRPGARSLWRVLGLLAIAASPLGVHQVLRNQYLKVAYDLNAVRAEQDSLRKEEELLRVERARLESYARIEAWALDDRGLVAPDASRVIVLPVDDREPLEIPTSDSERRAADPEIEHRLAGWVAP